MSRIPYIEFVGVAGSGKSEAMHILKRELSARGRSVYTRAPLGCRLFLKLKLCVSMLGAVCRVPALLVYACARPNDTYRHTPHIRKTLVKLSLRIYVEYAVLIHMVRNDERQLLNDEGLIGKLVSLSILVNMPAERVVAIAAKLLPVATTLVVVETPPQSAIERENARPVVIPFFRDMDTHTKTTFFEEATERYVRVSNELEALGRTHVVRVRNDADIEALAGEIIRIADVIR